ncbi:HepT-like ribonuclease domain-containing protein [Methylomonas sp. AM2-LC]|uniref:HepT-like ribonuclease domain-containing protein n=1 Tax=Methylomonas sp. AM2-LC TaxID=3153301 RepID=UPI003262E865
MINNRLPDYIVHMQQTAKAAFSFVDGLDKADYLEDKRTQLAVFMSLIIISEAAWFILFLKVT